MKIFNDGGVMPLDWQELTRLTDGEDLLIEKVRLTRRGISIEGHFELPPLARLGMEDQVFAAAFLKSHGSIKQMEKFFGVSYPTIKNRLNRIGEQLDFVRIESIAETGEILDKLAGGEISVAEAVEKLKRQE
jgi:hypothetical protein